MSDERPRTARIVDALEEDPGLTYAEITARTGVDLRVAYAILERLRVEGRVVNEANRWYPTGTRDDSA